MRVAFPTDEHHPFVDRHALSLAMQIVEDFDPDIRIAGSDGMDFYSISKFNKNPARLKEGGLQEEIDSWQRAQRAWMDASPNAEVFFLVGNHEDRLRKYLWNNPELYGLRALELENLLDLSRYNIQMADDNGREVVVENNLLVKHGSMVRRHGGYTARGELEKEGYAISTLSGHTHRGGHVVKTTRNGIIQGVEGFCLCRTDPEYMYRPDWQNGIVLATVSAFSVQFDLIPFVGNPGETKYAQWRDKEYVSK